MTLYQPSFLTPENLSINSSVNNTFTWQNNGDSPQTDYRLYILKNSDNTVVYDSTKTTSTSTQHIVPANTLSSNILYKWFLKIYSGATEVTSDYIIFKTNSPPTVSLSVTNLTVQNYTFTATYSQSESVPVKCFRFILYDNLNNILRDSDWIYDTTIQYQVTGMVTGTTYKIECQTIDQNEMTATSGVKTFTVNYDLPDTVPALTVTEMNDIGAIKLEWGNIKQVLPAVSGTYQYVSSKFNKGIHLDVNTTLTYTEGIPKDFTLIKWIKLPVGYSGIFLKLGNDFEVGYDGDSQRFFYQNQYRITAGLTRILPTEEFLVGIKQSKVIIKAPTFEEIIE